MLKSFNKGEWCELYVFVKSLGLSYFDVKDATLTNSLRQTKIHCLFKNNFSDTKEISFFPDSIDSNAFLLAANQMFSIITSSSKTTFSIVQIEDFAKQNNFSVNKAKSSSKVDLSGQIYELNNDISPKVGFSIKSNISSPATLLNASGNTNFRYRVTGISDELAHAINQIHSRKKLRDRIDIINASGGIVTFKQVDSLVFRNNLLLIDSRFDIVLAEALLLFYEKNVSSIKDMVNLLSQSDPLNFGTDCNIAIYEELFKRFLNRLVVDFTPGKPLATSNSNVLFGGLIIVNKNGEISLIDNRSYPDELSNYLFNNVKFDSPSSSRYHMLELEKVSNDEYEFTLNMQLRFR